VALRDSKALPSQVSAITSKQYSLEMFPKKKFNSNSNLIQMYSIFIDVDTYEI